jgi:hypothetical protein
VIGGGDEHGAFCESRVIEAFEDAAAWGVGTAEDREMPLVAVGNEFRDGLEELGSVDVDQDALDRGSAEEAPNDTEQHGLAFDVEKGSVGSPGRKGQGILTRAATRQDDRCSRFHVFVFGAHESSPRFKGRSRRWLQGE